MRVALRIQLEEQIQFGRRRRDLHYYYRIDKKRVGKKTVYIYSGPLWVPRDATPADAKTRASDCTWRMGAACTRRRTIEKHGITLVVDHKIPREWAADGSGQPLGVCRRVQSRQEEPLRFCRFRSHALRD